MVHTPRVFTIPASVPFLPTLIRALMDGTLVPGFAPGVMLPRDPLALAAATIYLPTRRACRLARDMFLEVSGLEAAILPRIVPIGDVDEDEILFDQAASGARRRPMRPICPKRSSWRRRWAGSSGGCCSASWCWPGRHGLPRCMPARRRSSPIIRRRRWRSPTISAGSSTT